MFNALKNEINSILNEKASFGTFLENTVRPENNDAIWQQYKNIAILGVQYGELAFLPNNKGLTGSMQLQLLMRVEDDVLQMEALQEITDYLLAHSNGVLQEDENYYYVLNYGIPSASGVIEITNGGIRYEVITIEVSVVLASEFMLGELAEVKIGITTGGTTTYYAIDNVTSFLLTPKTTLDTSTLIRSKQPKSTVTGHGFAGQLVIRYNDGSTTNKYLYENCIKNNNAIKFQYKLPHEASFNSVDVITHDNTLSMPRGEFAVLTINMGLSF